MKDTERKRYIDGIKGVACCAIVLGHYCGIYTFAQDASQIQCKVMLTLTDSFFGFFTNSGLWLLLFFVISGYLLAYARMNTFLDFFKKAIVRFVRLALPVLGAGLMIYGIQQIFGFYNGELQTVVPNQWIASSYQNRVSLADVFMSPYRVLLQGDAVINAPYWVLKDMFLGSLLIYASSYVKNRVEKRFPYAPEVLGAVLLGGLLIWNRIILFACVFGMLINWEEPRIGKLYRKSKLLPLLGLVLPVAGYLLENDVFYCFCIAALLTAIPEIPAVRKACETKLLLWLGKLSFGIYSLHWPVICSLGAVVLLRGSMRVNNNVLALLAFALCFGAVLLLSFLFHITFEKWTGWICGKMQRFPSQRE